MFKKKKLCLIKKNCQIKLLSYFLLGTSDASQEEVNDVLRVDACFVSFVCRVFCVVFFCVVFFVLLFVCWVFCVSCFLCRVFLCRVFCCFFVCRVFCVVFF